MIIGRLENCKIKLIVKLVFGKRSEGRDTGKEVFETRFKARGINEK
jgi:hypothetical protein